MSENNKQDASFYKWITGILVSAISFFLIKTYNKLDRMEEVMNQLNTSNAIHEFKIESNSTRINILEKRVDGIEQRIQSR
jgi:HAMP domain-containing protein